MVEEIFSNADNYLSFFKEIDDMYKMRESTFNSAVAEIHERYGYLLEDGDDETKESPVFLVPEAIKPKNESKRKSRSSQATANRTLTSVARKSKRSCRHSVQVKCEPDAEISLRKSTRKTSKAKVVSAHASKESIIEENENDETFIVSKTVQPNTSRYTEINELQDRMQFLSLSEISVCTEQMKNPVGCSTPTIASPEIFHMIEDGTVTENQASVSKPENDEKKESFQKPIEQSEINTKALQPNKPQISTPKETAFLMPSSMKNKKAATSQAVKKSDRILREKNKVELGSVKSKNKVIVAKKTLLPKPNTKDTKSKREERVRKLATQREAIEKKKPGVIKKLAGMKLTEIPENDVEQQIPVNRIKKEPKMDEDGATANTSRIVQYPIGQISENEYSEDEDRPKSKIPDWAKREVREYPLKVQAWLNKKETVYKWFYNKNLKTPNLSELFSCDVKMRPRTSSAVWSFKN